MNKKLMGTEAGKDAGRHRAAKAAMADAAQAREEIAAMIRSAAQKIAQALIDQALNGEAAPAKYLFEFAQIFPAATDADESSQQEDSLAKTLMHRLNLPEEPIQRDDENGSATLGGNEKKNASDD